jgi:hypothetical protein
VVFVLGYYADGDGGGGTFRWDGSSTTTDDGGLVIAPYSNKPTCTTLQTSAGRWRRVYSGPLNVRWFGAKGDLSQNDQPAFAAALAAIPNGGTVFVPTGRYLINSPIIVSAPSIVVDGSTIPVVRSGVRIIGEGQSSEIHADYTSVQESIITLLGCYRCRVENLYLTGVTSGAHRTNCTDAIYINANQGNTGRNELVNLRIGSAGGAGTDREFDVGVQIYSNPDANNELNVIQNVHIQSCRSQGIYLMACSNSNWNTIIGGSISYCENGIRCAGGNFVLFGTGFGAITTSMVNVYAVDDPSVYAQRYYPILLVGARAESVGKIIDTTGTGQCFVRFVDLSCVTGGDPLVSFTLPGFLSFDSCNILGLAGAGMNQHRTPINVSGTNTMLTITNSRLEIDAVNLTNGAKAHLSGNLWVNTSTLGGPRVTGPHTAIGQHALPNGTIPAPVFGPKRTATATPITVDYNDFVVLSNMSTAGAVTVNLPAAANIADGRSLVIKDLKGDANTNNITINAGTSTTIDGASSKVINTARGFVRLIYDGASGSWNVV